jgi:hypothetical protein
MQVKQNKDTRSIYLASPVPSLVTNQTEDKTVPVFHNKAHSFTFRRWVLLHGDMHGDAWWRKLERLTQIAQ